MYAPENTLEFPGAIACRSASLFHLNRFKDCMKDIDLAIELNYPKQLHYDLHRRKLECYLKLGNTDLAKQMVTKIRESIDDPSYIAPSTKDDVEKHLSGLTFDGSCTPDQSKNSDDPLDLRSVLTFDENPNFPHASSSIDLKFNEEVGRHVVANRPIQKGEVLFFEKPISFAFENNYGVGRVCQHCCRSTDTPLPCPLCLDTFYCNTNCLNEAWFSYHRWICLGNQMGIWEEKVVPKLALKVLLVCTTTTDAIKFNEMQNLITHFDKIPKEKLISAGTTAIRLTMYLSKHTDFFQRNDLNDFARKFFDQSFNSNFQPITDHNKHLYVSSLLLRYMLQLSFNGSLICKISTETIRSEDQSVANLNPFQLNNKTDALATGIYLSASMMNHSCDSNIVTNFMDQYQVVRAWKDIAANEEIVNCYGRHYKEESTENRQRFLSSMYYFTCTCKPCTQPNLNYVVERHTIAMKCSKCNGALCNIQNSLFCLDCFNRPEHFPRDQIEQAEKLFKEAENCADQNAGLALKKLEECLNIRRAVLYQYNRDIVSTTRVMSKLYMTRYDLEDFKKCGELMIATGTAFSGPSRVELINVLYELVGECLIHLRATSHTLSRTYRAILITAHEYLDQLQVLVNLNYGTWSDAYKVYKYVKDTLDILQIRQDYPNNQSVLLAMQIEIPMAQILRSFHFNRHTGLLPL
ncbi:protein-lysine N-methyltransferase SMYD4-like [Lasioglossum baleicum]|uniref:protein-lysine N-methyltransferase SMYD4-like n=1 Tax=Lasioglossum baleicum TaxID=434251 RepID=UPI003FCE37AB